MANSKSWVCLAHREGFAMLCKLSFDMQNCGCYLNHYGAGSLHPENFAGCSPTAAFQWRSVLQLKQHNCHGSPWVTMGCRWSPSRSHMSHLLVLDVARCCSTGFIIHIIPCLRIRNKLPSTPFFSHNGYEFWGKSPRNHLFFNMFWPSNIGFSMT